MKSCYTGNVLPTHWYNIAGEYPELYIPPVDPRTGEPLSSKDMLHLFPEILALQDVNTQYPEIKIPVDVI